MKFKSYLQKIHSLENLNYIENKIEKYPKIIQEKLRVYKDLNKIHQRIIGLELLEKAIKELKFNDTISLYDINYNEYGKPFLPTNFDFSISYTKDCVFLCTSERGKIGIDAEIWIEKDIKPFVEYFSKKEWKIICSNNQPSKCFFEFWTRKEAFVKAVGMGVFVDLSTIEVIENSIKYNGEKWKIETKFIEEKYILSTVINF